jgi:hypothetical protein
VGKIPALALPALLACLAVVGSSQTRPKSAQNRFQNAPGEVNRQRDGKREVVMGDGLHTMLRAQYHIILLNSHPNHLPGLFASRLPLPLLTDIAL